MRDYDTIVDREYDTIVDEVPVVPVVPVVRDVREQRESSVERLASLVYRLLMAYIWIWVAILVIGLVGYVVSLVS